MIEIVLTYPTKNGTGEVFVDTDKVTFGRGSEAAYRFEDDGLSRLHASIYREEDDIWIVDENSSNGTFVNGQKVGTSGTPLTDGDTVKIGHYTNIRVSIREKEFADETSANANTQTVASAHPGKEKSSMLIPLAITAFALLIVASSIIFIGVKVLGNGETETAQNHSINDEFGTSADRPKDDNENPDEPTNNDSNPVNTGTNTTVQADSASPDGTNITDSPTASKTDNPINITSGKTYQQLSPDEKNQYVKIKAEKVAQIIGNSSSQSIPPEAVAIIKRWLDGYVGRIRSNRKDDCSGKGYLSSDMVSLMQRASQNAPFIIKEFNRQDIDPKVGLYLAMIESEHCPCLQSYSGPLGLFQFTTATGRAHGLNTRLGASPSNPDQRCDKEPAAKAAASYMKSLTARIGTGPLSIPLAVASYNSGEGGLGSNLKTALTANESQERSFWTLVINAEKLAAQFQRENIKYVPKFFAAAIIGENPKDFGMDMLPLSTYAK